ncbi:MAG TPA: flavohemoglobin expression-modulating QEGLA motif protein [Thermoanaerobaculia bacterium]|nr:flavohemoglobin expression-modulating QEGLA motif protein [Thermoanaerobaculia bacterium]
MSAPESYLATVRELSDRLVELQRPIRILDAIKWGTEVEERFFEQRGRELPQVDRALYESRPLSFDPAAKRAELQELERQLRRQLGRINPVAEILSRMCREYERVVAMLEARGTPEFTRFSQDLYGSAHDVFHAGDPTLADLGALMFEALGRLADSPELVEEAPIHSGEEAVAILRTRLEAAFEGTGHEIRIELSDGIVADAAAGADYIKIRREARFTDRDLRLLEIHEGWVHLGTSLNGRSQPVCTFLSKGPPSSTVTQEGLAVLMEILTFSSYPARLRKLTNRIQGIELAEDGADFLEVYRYFLEQGASEREAYGQAARVFRGSLPTAGPFTKDLSYSKGFVLIYNYLLLAVRRGQLQRIPLIYCGKTTLEDLRLLEHLVEEGVVQPPRFLPPQFADLKALAAWMCYANFLSRLDLERIEADYAEIL